MLRLPLLPRQRLGLLLVVGLAYPWACTVYEAGCAALDVYTAREARAALGRVRKGWSPEQVAQAIGYPPDGWSYTGQADSPDTSEVWPVGSRRIRVVYWRRRAVDASILAANPGPLRQALDDFFYAWLPEVD
jgi:hypothetical protein